MVTMATVAILKISTLNAQLHTLSIIPVNIHCNRIKNILTSMITIATVAILKIPNPK
jgi:hypothetical protein